MAEGYAHVTGRPGVAMVTSGPGGDQPGHAADGRLHGLDPDGRHHRSGADRGDRQRRLPGVRHRRHHPLVTKHNELVMTAEDMPMAIRQAFHIATTGRPGPTLVDVPKDVLQRRWSGTGRPTPRWPRLPGYRPNAKGHPRMIKEAAKLILASERPVIYAGGGILKARAAEALRELAELLDIHVVTTLMARGAFPDDHPLCLGMPGMHGNATAVTAHAAQRPADHPRCPIRRPDHRQGRRSRPTPRSSTSTSIRPSRARSAGPTCRSSVTPSTSSSRSSGRSGTCCEAARCRPTRGRGRAVSRLARAVPDDLRAVRARARR